MEKARRTHRIAVIPGDGIGKETTPEELDRPFVLRSPQPTVTRTLRERVVRTAAEHLREHQAHLAETLVRWRAAQSVR